MLIQLKKKLPILLKMMIIIIINLVLFCFIGFSFIQADNIAAKPAWGETPLPFNPSIKVDPNNGGWTIPFVGVSNQQTEAGIDGLSYILNNLPLLGVNVSALDQLV